MRANISKKLIYCKKCKKWVDAYTEVYLPDETEEKSRIVRHLDCDTILGYEHDKEWRAIFGED